MVEPRSPGVMRAELKRYRFHSAPAPADTPDPAAQRQRAAWYAKEALLLQELLEAIDREFQAELDALQEARLAALGPVAEELAEARKATHAWHERVYRAGEEMQTVDFTNGARSSLSRERHVPQVFDQEKLDGFIGERGLEGDLLRRVPARVEPDKARLNKLIRPKVELDTVEPGATVPAVMEDFATGEVLEVPGVQFEVKPMRWGLK